MLPASNKCASGRKVLINIWVSFVLLDIELGDKRIAPNSTSSQVESLPIFMSRSRQKFLKIFPMRVLFWTVSAPMERDIFKVCSFPMRVIFWTFGILMEFINIAHSEYSSQALIQSYFLCPYERQTRAKL